MTTAISFLISILIGYFAVLAVFRKSGIPCLLSCFLSVGVGLGISALLTFYSFLIFDKFHPAAIIILHTIVLTGLSLYCFKNQKSMKTDFDGTAPVNRQSIFGAMLCLAALAVTLFFALKQFFGQWDAWALWNMKAKFLTTSGHAWKAAFTQLHWHTQPDYPLLLPMMTIWGWVMDANNFYTAPFVVAVIFTVACIGLLFCALERYARKDIALIGGSFLFFLPWFLTLATAQYADIILAYELLASFICLAMILREGNENSAILLGFFLGLMTFTKNEGIMIALLLFLMTAVYLFSNRSFDRPLAKKLSGFMMAGLLFPVSATMIFKIFLAPHNPDIALKYMTFASRFFNFEGCYMIIYALMQEVTHNRWHYLWACLAVLITLEWRKYFYKEIKIFTWFFIVYFTVLFIVYLGTVNFDLMWRLSRTLSRILFTLLPSIVFVVFYAYDYENKWPKKNPEK